MPIPVERSFTGKNRWYQIFARALHEWHSRGRKRVLLTIDKVGVQRAATMRTEFYLLRSRVNASPESYPDDFRDQINSVRVAVSEAPHGIVIYPAGVERSDLSPGAGDITESVDAAVGPNLASRQKFSLWISEDHNFGDKLELDGTFNLDDKHWFDQRLAELGDMIRVEFSANKVIVLYTA